MTGRESVDAKGRRYLVEGRLVVDVVVGAAVRARCRGTGATYAVAYDSATGWRCDCPARRWCAHLVATALVVSPSATDPRRSR